MRDAATARVFAVDAIAFDLDGTLLDTIGDLAAAVNALLLELRLPSLPQPTIQDLVGKGMPNLLARAPPRRGCGREGEVENVEGHFPGRS